jgi:hypothetical protein
MSDRRDRRGVRGYLAVVDIPEGGSPVVDSLVVAVHSLVVAVHSLAVAVHSLAVGSPVEDNRWALHATPPGVRKHTRPYWMY